jgi:hypothetical protein
MHQILTARFTVLLAVILGLLALRIIFGLAWPPAVEAGGTLPPRTPPATPVPKEKHKKRDAPLGAYIVLQLGSSQSGTWTVVQWQDSAGGWHNVGDWQGPPEDSGRQWWVAAKDFGKGPFRWLVTQGPGGAQVGVSGPFNLPASANQTVLVTVSP